MRCDSCGKDKPREGNWFHKTAYGRVFDACPECFVTVVQTLFGPALEAREKEVKAELARQEAEQARLKKRR